ncbi:MAG: signal peptidase I [Leptolyngbyaceae cyanobacterium MO_188.B28]|nr:signal peptidase I [Leptolyngbyaceae cyanobacterium MO_188.B28]
MTDQQRSPQKVNQQDSNTQTSNTQETRQNEPFWASVWNSQRENVKIFAIALFVALFIRLFVAEPRFIPSASMEPTLHAGDRLLVEKVAYHLHPPRYGDIVVFNPPLQLQRLGFKGGQAFIKRVIATAGQTIEVSQGQIFLDGAPLDESYILESPHYKMPAVVVPQNCVFVMGDNRNDSNDSHIWGFLPEANIIGHAEFRFWPLARFGEIG